MTISISSTYNLLSWRASEITLVRCAQLFQVILIVMQILRQSSIGDGLGVAQSQLQFSKAVSLYGKDSIYVLLVKDQLGGSGRKSMAATLLSSCLDEA